MAGKSKNIILQKRDIKIILACYEYRLLTRDQLRRLFGFGTVTGVNARLHKLSVNGYLERRFLPIAAATSQGVYTVGPKGEDIISNIIGLNQDEVTRRRRRNNKIGAFFVKHLIETNDVRIIFSLSPNIELIRWAYEPEICLNGGKRLRPDAFFQALYENKLYSFFLELDRGTESNNRFVAMKVPTYLKMIRDNIQTRDFGINYFGVLVVVQSTERLNNLWVLISRKIKGVFWFVEKDRLNSNSLIEPIFAKAGHESRLSIFGGER